MVFGLMIEALRAREVERRSKRGGVRQRGDNRRGREVVGGAHGEQMGGAA